MNAQALKVFKFRSYIFLAIMVLGSVCMDQVTKIHAEKSLMVWNDPDNKRMYQGERFPLWTWGEETDFSDRFFLSFNFNYVRNQGAAWGALSDLSDSIRDPFFYLITAIAIFIILSYLRQTPIYYKLARFSLMLILSGAIGNFLDRVRLGYVIDFIDVRWNIPLPFSFSIDFFPSFLSFFNTSGPVSNWHYNFPNFNWADSCITVGVSFLLIDLLFFEKKRQEKEAVLRQQAKTSTSV